MAALPPCAALRTPSCSPPRNSSVNMAPLSSTSMAEKRGAWLADGGLAGSARRPSHQTPTPKGRFMANSQGHDATDRMAAATDGPAMDAVATTSELMAMPWPSCARG